MAPRTAATPALKPEIAFIDRGVDDIETLLAGMRPEVEPILQSDEEPAPRQMARAVRGREATRQSRDDGGLLR
jgi:hypothetical protein